MIVYIPTSGANVCDALSQALWGLAKPPQDQGGDVTTHMFGFIECTDGSVWIQVDTEFTIPVHPEAVLDGIADIMQPWIDGGYLPADTNEKLSALIDSMKGKQLKVYDAFPQLFKDQSKTREELIALNLLSDPLHP